MQGYCEVYKWTILNRTSPEVKCLHLTSSRREMCTLSVSNVIYHKFSHGAAFYSLNGKNVNVMLEFRIFLVAFLLNWGHFLKDIICSCRSNFFSLRDYLFWKGYIDHGSDHRVFAKMAGNITCRRVNNLGTLL